MMSSRFRVSSFARRCFWTTNAVFFLVGTILLMVQACSPGSDKLKYFILTICGAFICPLTIPHWIISTLVVILLGGVPFAWNLYQNISTGRDTGMLDLCFGCSAISSFGLRYGAWVAVHQRKAWLAQLKAAAGLRKPSARSEIEWVTHALTDDCPPQSSVALERQTIALAFSAPGTVLERFGRRLAPAPSYYVLSVVANDCHFEK